MIKLIKTQRVKMMKRRKLNIRVADLHFMRKDRTQAEDDLKVSSRWGKLCGCFFLFQ